MSCNGFHDDIAINLNEIMPKVKKSSSVQTSISRYFGGKSNSFQLLGGDQKLLSVEELPAKRARLSQQEELDCEPPCSQKEPKVTTHRRGGTLCSSTLEKLKGFTSVAKHSINNSNSHEDTEENTPSSNISQRQGGMPPREASDQLKFTKVLQKPQECEDEERKEDAPDQRFCLSPFAKSGGAKGEKGAELGSRSSSSAPSKCSKSSYTPLEQQVVQLKQQHKDALLAVECGYKYRFFGDDAEIAAKELNITCHLDHNFMTCSIPTHRLFVHVRRLVSHGHKVGVVKQTETAAIKASGANRNALFTRQLSALYTKSTLVGEDVNQICSLEDVEEGSHGDIMVDPPDGFLLCISENWDKLKKQLTVGLVAVQPSTGDVFLDCFPDGSSRSELESRILKVNPVEILVPSDLSEETRRLLLSVTNASFQADDRARVERRDSAQFEYTSAINTVTQFYCRPQKEDSRSLGRVASFESPVICCLGPLIQYLQEFNLERVLRSESSFQRLSCESEAMILNAATLRTWKY
ncbi:DNA mismatch repair protein Msh3 [Oryzias melastigma]|uniref:DNA mismatch repair protein MSH3 n=1 Tax=Oryzias melastigma TaxID=30732 RepID=A0A834FD28_ORYME|nr:DNA mismatch repair protein Msh3 [Oryzias melastigma]